MYLEQELYSTLLWAFIVVIIVCGVAIGILFVKTRNRNLIWIVGQLLLLSLAFRFLFQAITNLPDQMNAMYSEDQSLRLALAGVCWATSMALMMIGIIRSGKPKTDS